jgi:hypothetical protein
MRTSLPTANDLEKLPLRAVVAYAARTARRVSAEFRGIVADDVLDEALRLIDDVTTTHLLADVDAVSVVRASECVVAAYEAAPAEMQSTRKNYLVFSFVQAALAATSVIEAARGPSKAWHQRKRAAREAQLAVDPIRSLEGEAAIATFKSAREDVDLLVGNYGKHDEVVIGPPIDCFNRD